MIRYSRRISVLVGAAVLVAAMLIGTSIPGVVSASVNVSSGLTSVHEAALGEQCDGAIVLDNPGQTTERVEIYQTDYRFTADGHAYYDDPGTLPRSNASWIRLGQSTVDIPPRSSVTVPYRIQVPAGKGMVGTYWSMVMVEMAGSIDSEAPIESAKDEKSIVLGIKQKFRYGIQIVTNIGSTGKKKVAFSNPALQRVESSGELALSVDLANAGERMLTFSVWVEVYDKAGAKLGKFDGRDVKLYPDTSSRATIALGSLAPGSYRVIVVADNHDEYVAAVRYSLEVSAP